MAGGGKVICWGGVKAIKPLDVRPVEAPTNCWPQKSTNRFLEKRKFVPIMDNRKVDVSLD